MCYGKIIGNLVCISGIDEEDWIYVVTLQSIYFKISAIDNISDELLTMIINYSYNKLQFLTILFNETVGIIVTKKRESTTTVATIIKFSFYPLFMY